MRDAKVKFVSAGTLEPTEPKETEQPKLAEQPKVTKQPHVKEEPEVTEAALAQMTLDSSDEANVVQVSIPGTLLFSLTLSCYFSWASVPLLLDLCQSIAFYQDS